MSADIGGVRGLRQPPRSVHLLFSLRTQHDRAFRVDGRRVQNPDVHNEHVQHRSRQFQSKYQPAALGRRRSRPALGRQGHSLLTGGAGTLRKVLQPLTSVT